jgi:hypothetical protein
MIVPPQAVEGFMHDSGGAMPRFKKGGTKKGVRVSGKKHAPLPYSLGERERETERVRIPKGRARKPAPQSKQTSTKELTGPGGEEHGIVFPTYTPLSKPKNPGLFGFVPPDMSGANSEGRVVLFTGNSYLCASKDDGASFADLDSTTFLPKIPKRADDQVMIYVPRINSFAWMMQHGQSPGTNDGNVRLAIAKADKLATSFTSAWTVFDFTSSNFGFPGVATDRQDLSFTEKYLYLTTNIVGKGRIIIRIPLSDFAKGTVTWQYTPPLDGVFQFSDLSQQNGVDTYMAGIVDGSTLRVFSCTDGNNNWQTRDVRVGSFPRAGDLVSKDPNKVDWLTKGVANVSAALSNGDDLWLAWDAAKSDAGDNPFYPHAHARIAQVKVSTWKVVSEAQVWNPDYAFAYATLAMDGKGNLGYGVAVGGPKDFPMSCFGVLGDFVVYYQDNSDATAMESGAGGVARWGDYITVRPSAKATDRFSAFGYFTKKQAGGTAFQTPYYLVFGRP